jgi:hypothetical protein
VSNEEPTWIVLARDVTGIITVTGEPTVALSMVVDVATGLVRAVAMGGTVRAACADAARRALSAPADPLLPQPPARVAYDVAHADDMLSALTEALPATGPATGPELAAITPPARAEDLFDSLISRLTGVPQPDVPPSPRDWAQLYTASAAYYRARPWQLWTDADELDLVTEVDGERHRHVVIVYGAHGIQRGLAVLPVHPAAGHPAAGPLPSTGPSPTGALTLYLDPPHEVPRERLAKAQRYGWPRAADCVPIVAQVGASGLVDVDQRGARQLLLALTAVVAHQGPRSSAMTTGTVELDEGAAGQYTISDRRSSPDGKSGTASAHPLTHPSTHPSTGRQPRGVNQPPAAQRPPAARRSPAAERPPVAKRPTVRQLHPDRTPPETTASPETTAPPETTPTVPAPAPLAPLRTLRMRVRLREVVPPVVRVVDVPSAATLPELHQLLQVAIGWTNTHLHEFVSADGKRYGRPDPDDLDLRSEDAATLPDLYAQFSYLYDFGDGWEHDVEIISRGGPAPGCVEGEGACPPEDCGGAYGYAELLEALGDPAHPDHDQLRTWAAAWSPDWTEADLREADRMVRATVGQVPASVRLVLDLVGQGVRLTPGGRLPRAFVRAVQDQRPEWAYDDKPASLEEDLYPLYEMHQTLRRVGLLRLAHGTLTPTRAATDELQVIRKLRRAFEAHRFDDIVVGVATAHLAARGGLPREELAELTLPWLRFWSIDGRPMAAADVDTRLSNLRGPLVALDLVQISDRTWYPGPSAETLFPQATALAHILRREAAIPD